jgi:hypothetical protein
MVVGVAGFVTLGAHVPVGQRMAHSHHVGDHRLRGRLRQDRAGRLFTILLILGGLSVFAFGIQAGATFPGQSSRP